MGSGSNILSDIHQLGLHNLTMRLGSGSCLVKSPSRLTEWPSYSLRHIRKYEINPHHWSGKASVIYKKVEKKRIQMSSYCI